MSFLHVAVFPLQFLPLSREGGVLIVNLLSTPRGMFSDRLELFQQCGSGVLVWGGGGVGGGGGGEKA